MSLRILVTLLKFLTEFVLKWQLSSLCTSSNNFLFQVNLFVIISLFLDHLVHILDGKFFFHSWNNGIKNFVLITIIGWIGLITIFFWLLFTRYFAQLRWISQKMLPGYDYITILHILLLRFFQNILSEFRASGCFRAIIYRSCICHNAPDL